MDSEIREAASRRKSEEAVINGLRAKLGKAKPEERSALMQEITSQELTLTEVPRAPRLLADDTTPEAAAALMAEHGQRLGIISAEGGLFDTLAGRYSSGVPNLDLFLKGHSGDPVRVDRRHAQPVEMESPALTLCLSPQPEIMAGLADKPGFRSRGLIARFAFVLPASRMGHRQVSPPPVPGHVMEGYRRAIRTLLALDWGVEGYGEPTAHILRLSADARREWEAFSGYVEAELGDGGSFEMVRDWGGKLSGLAARLAGLIHAMEYQEQAPGRPVSQATMDSALGLAGALVGHALAAFGMMGADPDIEAAKHALAWIRRECVERFTVRDCHRALRGRYPKAAQVQAGLAILEERAFIFPQAPPRGGPGRPPGPAYTINPRALEE
jgi:putative DNA primase/helicase